MIDFNMILPLSNITRYNFVEKIQNLIFDMVENIQEQVKEECIFKKNSELSKTSSRRINQLFLNNFGTSEFIQDLSKCIEKDLDPETFFKGKIKTKNLTLNYRNRTLSYNYKFFLKTIFKFFILWNWILLNVLKSYILGILFLKKDTFKNFVLFDDQPTLNLNNKNNLQNFIDFCNNGPIDILKNSNIIIGNSINKKLSSKIHSYKRPLIGAINHTQFTTKDLALFLLNHIKNLSLFAISINTKFHFLLYRDLAFLSYVKLLDSKKIIKDYVITNSSWNNQEIWFDLKTSFKTNTIWYSSNCFPLLYEKPQGKNIYGIPVYKYMKSNTHWTWSEKQAAIFKERHPNTNCHVCGPIMFYLNKTIKNIIPNKKFEILLLDVTPISSKVYDELVGYAYKYYSSTNGIKFVNDVCEVSKEQFGDNCNIKIKPKRVYDSIHDKKYISYIQEMNSNETIKIVPHDTDIFKLISESDLVICIPFTSPAYIAKKLNIKTIYFDPTEKLYINSKEQDIEFISGKLELSKYMKNNLSN